MSLDDFLVAFQGTGSARADVTDYLQGHPVPKPPPDQAPPPDPVMDAMGETTSQHARRTPFSGRGRSMRLVDNTVCKFPCQVPGHNHNQPVFRPDPELDEVGIGWTVQHIPTNFERHKVPKRCVLCWSMEENLSEHSCQVVAILHGC